jgi:hypothetical protein
MRFKCALTKLEKERLKQTKIDHLCHWHKWFAWYPVTVGEFDCRWLEWVDRKGKPQYHLDSAHDVVSISWEWEYKPY